MQRRDGGPLTHDWIWCAIDTLARRQQLSPSALARRAGLDPTTFNRSKRFTPEGRPRWPSTESISKVLQATGTALDEFATIELGDTLGITFDETAEGEINGVPIVGRVRDGAVDDWQPIIEPGNADTDDDSAGAIRRRFALLVADSSLEPVYSRGNTLVVSEAAEPRSGDRVLVKPIGMPVVPRLLVSASAAKLEFSQFGAKPQLLAIRRRDINWMARIVLVRH
jgi:phage repressor protein C with HTH and peptisase S24 domain